MNKTKKAVCICSVVLVAAFSLPAFAQTDTQSMTPDEIDARHDADMKHCDTLKGNDRDVCEKEADARRDSAKANAKEGKETAEARQEATEEKRDANYDVAKEKCDAMSGDAKDQCIANAKAKYNK
ncbi:hypothetical protein ERD78_04505 [Allopusillimonas soli]|uniref:Cell envelope biogenesis protein TolA n=1 Tax=Allopusillimonas soli TaxID=659016 RepID=A0A853FC45_9BURK|nr:hypothetical protein [Allopusillimonas soli]NYT36121.1 hypothetical protein [Allopusillimonas soli]TEA76456.1 hypothetical protein ERD78_04505 [Allopusillimonas soli]